MENKSRRNFIKKSVYVVPTIVSLGALATPAEASKKKGSTIEIEKNNYEWESTENENKPDNESTENKLWNR